MLEIIYENAPLVDGEPDTFSIQGDGDPAASIKRLSRGAASGCCM
ncbi:MAG: hypothetical protein V8T86_08425 [Victivallis sp.]